MRALVSPVGACGLAGVLGATGCFLLTQPGSSAPRTAPDGRVLTESERSSTPSNAADTDLKCLGGTVSSAGVLGGPLADVVVRAEVDGKDAGETRADHHGLYRVCVPISLATFTDKVFSPDDYADRTVSIRLHFSRDGYADRVMTHTWFTGSPERFDAILERSDGGGAAQPASTSPEGGGDGG
jgi:hypothetical protein